MIQKSQAIALRNLVTGIVNEFILDEVSKSIYIAEVHRSFADYFRERISDEEYSSNLESILNFTMRKAADLLSSEGLEVIYFNSVVVTIYLASDKWYIHAYEEAEYEDPYHTSFFLEFKCSAGIEEVIETIKEAMKK